jgi:hypothetical protein
MATVPIPEWVKAALDQWIVAAIRCMIDGF